MNTNLKTATAALQTPQPVQKATYSKTTPKTSTEITNGEQKQAFGDWSMMNTLIGCTADILADKIKELRIKRGISQYDLGRRATLSQGTISRAERGHGISVYALLAIINALEANIKLEDSK